MSDPLCVTAGIIVVVTAAIQATSALYDTIANFMTYQKGVRKLRNQLSALANVLRSLRELAEHDDTESKILLEECRRSWRNGKPSFAEWMKLRYKNGDIASFIESLAVYKITVGIAVADVGFWLCRRRLDLAIKLPRRTSKVTLKVFNEYEAETGGAAQQLQGHFFDTLMRSTARAAYEEFIIPKLCHLLAPLSASRGHRLVSEIGPGPKSVLGSLPDSFKLRIRRFTAFGPNESLDTQLEESLCDSTDTASPLSCLELRADIHRVSFNPNSSTGFRPGNGTEKFDLVLFCHSMYGMEHKCSSIERATEMLDWQLKEGLVGVFHRYNELHFDGLICHRATVFLTGVTRVEDDYEVLDSFSPFIVGFTMWEENENKMLRIEWRKVCHDLGEREEANLGHLFFTVPELMVAFTRQAPKLPELITCVSLASEDGKKQDPEARTAFFDIILINTYRINPLESVCNLHAINSDSFLPETSNEELAGLTRDLYIQRLVPLLLRKVPPEPAAKEDRSIAVKHRVADSTGVKGAKPGVAYFKNFLLIACNLARSSGDTVTLD